MAQSTWREQYTTYYRYKRLKIFCHIDTTGTTSTQCHASRTDARVSVTWGRGPRCQKLMPFDRNTCSRYRVIVSKSTLMGRFVGRNPPARICIVIVLKIVTASVTVTTNNLHWNYTETPQTECNRQRGDCARFFFLQKHICDYVPKCMIYLIPEVFRNDG